MPGRPTEEGTIELISPDGERKDTFSASTAAGLMKQGWTVAGGRSVGVRTDEGEAYMSPESAQTMYNPIGGSREATPITGAQQQADYDEMVLEDEYGDSKGLAMLAGAARGLTFGGSDLALTATGLVEGETLGALQDYNPISSAVGEFGTIIGSGVFGAGKGLVGKALRATPAGKVSAMATEYGAGSTARFIAAQGGEGALHGTGQKISQMAISDEPLTADRIGMELLEGGGIGGALGGAGGAVFKGASKLNQLRKGKPVPPQHFDISTPQGEKFYGGLSNNISKSLDSGEAMFNQVSPVKSRQYMLEELEEIHAYGRRTTQGVEEVLNSSEAEILSMNKNLEGLPNATKRLEAARKVLNDDPGIDLDELDEMRARLTKGIHVKKSVDGRYPDPSARPSWLEDPTVGSAPAQMDSHQLDRLMTEYRAMLASAPSPAMSADGVVSKQAMARVKQVKRVKREYDEAYEAYEDLILTVRPKRDAMVGATADVRRRFEAFSAQAPAAKVKFERANVGGKMSGRLEADLLSSLERANKSPAVVLEQAAKLNKSLRRGVSGLDDVVKDQGKFQGRLNDIQGRVHAPVQPGVTDAMTKYHVASKNLSTLVGGKSTPAGLAKVFSGGTPEDVSKMVQALSEQTTAMKQMAEASMDPALVKLADSNIAAIEKQIMGSLPPDLLEASKHINMNTLLSNEKVQAVAGLSAFAGIADEGPLDTLSKVAIMAALLRTGKGSKALQEATIGAAQQGGKQSMFKSAIGYMGGGAARHAVPGSGMVSAVARAGASFGGNRAAQRLLSAGGLSQASGRATGSIQQAVGRLMGGAGKSMMGGGGAAATLKLMHFDDEQKKERKENESELKSLFDSKANSLRKLVSNPQVLQQASYDAMQPLREVHPYLADKVEVHRNNALQLAYEALPKDPGTQHMMGVSTWQPDEFQMQEFANYVQGLIKPFSVLDGVMDGSITMAGAKAFREAYPPTFAALQVEIARKAPELQKKLSYDQQDRLATFMGVPINSMTTKEYSQFITTRYMEESAGNTESMGQVDANALIQGTPTQAQNLLNRGNKRTA